MTMELLFQLLFPVRQIRVIIYHMCMAVMLVEHHVCCDEFTCVTFDKQAEKFNFG